MLYTVYCRYVPASLVVYLESSDQKLLEISTSSTLLSAITKPGFLLKAGFRTQDFILFKESSMINSIIKLSLKEHFIFYSTFTLKKM